MLSKKRDNQAIAATAQADSIRSPSRKKSKSIKSFSSPLKKTPTKVSNNLVAQNKPDENSGPFITPPRTARPALSDITNQSTGKPIHFFGPQTPKTPKANMIVDKPKLSSGKKHAPQSQQLVGSPSHPSSGKLTTDLLQIKQLKKDNIKPRKKSKDPSFNPKGSNGNNNPLALANCRGFDKREIFTEKDGKEYPVKSAFLVHAPVFQKLDSPNLSQTKQLLHRYGNRQKTHSPIQSILEFSENGTPVKVKTKKSGTVLHRRKGKSGDGSDLILLSNLPEQDNSPIREINPQQAETIASGSVFPNVKPLQNSSKTVTADLSEHPKKYDKRVCSQSSVIMKEGVDSREQKAIATRYGQEFDSRLKYEIAHGIAYSLIHEASQTEENLMITSRDANSDKIAIEAKLNDPKFRKAFSHTIQDPELKKIYGTRLKLNVNRIKVIVNRIPVQGIEGCRLVADEYFRIEHADFRCNLYFNGQSNTPPHMSDFHYTQAIVDTLTDLKNKVKVPDNECYPKGQSPICLFERRKPSQKIDDTILKSDDDVVMVDAANSSNSSISLAPTARKIHFGKK